ncbi:Na+/H+ antiporter subunit E [Fusibacter ferrireducens]|uniref:Na+/H+ antiporter subunit E n=1 Tax=Fusibacter ferrireducens TaxID=2785058 RepID=A0ABR9ZWT3_9FIRM|nr:Na+/H+ antiporter subunit E [Fusibacter ferrireducens]MBF4694411.1 Na+/H+ antiporter subunit E [Fusibacter ferrireducens]
MKKWINKSEKIGILALFFLILTEHITVLNIVVALLIATLISKSLDSKVLLRPYIRGRILIKWIIYGGILFYEVIKANIQVALITLSRHMDIEPMVVTYESQLSDEWLLTILANSITLTPGTMTVDIKGNQLLIHCLNRSYSEGLSEMLLEKKLCEIERDING